MKAPPFVLALALAACGGKYGKTPTTPAGVESAVLPYHIVDARTGHDVPESEAWGRLAGARAVCLGEEHPNPHHHWAQMKLVEELGRRAKLSGTALALGLEMVQRPFQGVLDDYAAGRIDDAALVSRTGWEDRWGYDFAMYRPILTRALAVQATLIALNPAREITKKISHGGLDSLSPVDRAALPELVLDDPQHRAWWNDLMGSMGGAGGHTSRGDDGGEGDPHAQATADEDAARDERFYTVQVLWDESLAAGATTWIDAKSGRAMIILAGNGHCHDSAVINRIKRRGVPDALSIQIIIDDGGNVASELARPVNDYLFVMTMPEARSK